MQNKLIVKSWFNRINLNKIATIYRYIMLKFQYPKIDRHPLKLSLLLLLFAYHSERSDFLSLHNENLCMHRKIIRRTIHITISC